MLTLRGRIGEIVHFQAVLFDMDGVLTDNQRFHHAAWAACLAERYGIALAEGDARMQAGLTHEILERITGRRTSREEADVFREHKEARYRALARGRLAPVAGLTTYLGRLRACRVPYGLVTGSDAVCVDFVCRELRLDAKFAIQVTGDDVRHGKPHPEPYLLAIAGLGISPERCLVHEDSDGGVISASTAGAQVAALATSRTGDALRAAGARWVVPDFTAWCAALELA